MFGGHLSCFQGYILDDVDPCEQLCPFFHIRGSSVYKLTKPEQRTLSRAFWLACLHQPQSGIDVVVRNVLDARDGYPNH